MADKGKIPEQIADEPGMAERFQRGLARALNSPPQHRSTPKRSEKVVAAKEKKTEAELAALIMQEVRQHRGWSDIVDVAIIRPVQQATHHSNWDGTFTMSGNAIPPEGAFAIVRQLQGQFDLA